MSNYYELLGCRRDASLDELKKRYHEGAKKFHPDKSTEETQGHFLELQKAWRTLSDPAKRKEYDRELARNEFDGIPLYSDVDLSEMTIGTDGSTYTYGCRCGGVYALDKCEVKDADEFRVGCNDCSFHIQIRVPGGKTS